MNHDYQKINMKAFNTTIFTILFLFLSSYFQAQSFGDELEFESAEENYRTGSTYEMTNNTVLVEFYAHPDFKGLRNKEGKVILVEKYQSIKPIYNEDGSKVHLFVVGNNEELFNLFDPDRGLLLSQPVDRIFPAGKGYLFAILEDLRETRIIDYDGNEVTSRELSNFGETIRKESENFSIVQTNYYTGLVDNNTLSFKVAMGKQSIEFENGFIIVTNQRSKDPSILISQINEDVLWYSRDEKIVSNSDSTLLLQNRKSKDVFLQKLNGAVIWTGNRVIKGRLERDRLIYYSKETRTTGMVDLGGNEIIPAIYKSLWPVTAQDCWKITTLKGEMGIVNKDGKIIVPAIYSRVSPHKVNVHLKQFFFAEDEEGIWLYDDAGKKINSSVAQEIMLLEQSLNYILVRYGDLFHPYSFDGKTLNVIGVKNPKIKTLSDYKHPMTEEKIKKVLQIGFWATDEEGRTIVIDKSGNYFLEEEYFDGKD